MEPNYIVFLLDEDGKHPQVIAGGDKEEAEEIFVNSLQMYGARRLHLRVVSSPSAIWAATLPV